MASPEHLSLAGCRAAVITASDRSAAGTRPDLGGPAVVRVLQGAGAEVVLAQIVADDRVQLAAALRAACGLAGLVLTTGGTGFAPRDVTPEATRDVLEREAPGLADEVRRAGREQTRFSALGRGVCGTLGRSLILNLPGSPAGAESSLLAVLPLLTHALQLLGGLNPHEPVE